MKRFYYVHTAYNLVGNKASYHLDQYMRFWCLLHQLHPIHKVGGPWGIDESSDQNLNEDIYHGNG